MQERETERSFQVPESADNFQQLDFNFRKILCVWGHNTLSDNSLFLSLLFAELCCLSSDLNYECALRVLEIQPR